MRIVVTGSAGHLGEALMRTLRSPAHTGAREAVGLDVTASPYTDVVATLTDADQVERALEDAEAVLHTATLHKPHVAWRSKREFIDVNVVGTQVLLDAAVARGVGRFIFTSTTSAFGHALQPDSNDSEAPAVWIDESVTDQPKNIYGATKSAAESLCSLAHQEHGLACVVLRTSRFFPEPDDNPGIRETFEDANVKVNEFLHRRVDVEDVVSAHLQALESAPGTGFGVFIVSAPTPFRREHLAELRTNAPRVVESLFPDFPEIYARRGWKMFPRIERVYDSSRAQRELGWRPQFDFRRVLDLTSAGHAPQSDLARAVGVKGYGAESDWHG